MNTFNRVVLSIAYITVATWAISCSENDPVKKPIVKDPEVKDTEKPSVNITKPAAQKLSSIATFTIAASDNQKVARVQVFVDGVLVDDQALSVLTASVDFAWDTKSVDDGTHQIKIVVTDAAGNTKEETFDVVVRNVLMKFHVQPNAIAHTAYWAYISNHNGETVAIEQLKNDSEVILYAPEGYEDETFSLTYFAYDSLTPDAPGQIGHSLTINVDQSPHEETLSTIVTPVANVTGYITLHIKDVPGNYVSGFASGSNAYYSYFDQFVGGETLYYVPVLAETTDLLISLYDGNRLSTKYLYFENLASNTSLDVSFSNFKDYKPQDIFLPPSYTDAVASQFGRRTGSDIYYLLNYGTWASQPTPSIRMETPYENIFDWYETNIIVYNTYDGTAYINYSKTQACPQVFEELPINLNSHTFVDGEMSMAISGSAETFDVWCTLADGTGFPAREYAYRISGKAASTISFNVPVIPQQLLDRYYPEGILAFKPQGVQFTNHHDFGGGYFSDVQKAFWFPVDGGRLDMHSADKMRMMPFNRSGAQQRNFNNLFRPLK